MGGGQLLVGNRSRRWKRGLQSMQWYSTRQLLGIVAFLTFLGGPFFVADPLKPRIGSWPAILITCIPLGLMLFAAYSMVESRVRDRPSRAILWAGIFGMFLTLGEHLYALLNLPRWGENGVFHICLLYT